MCAGYRDDDKYGLRVFFIDEMAKGRITKWEEQGWCNKESGFELQPFNYLYANLSKVPIN